MGSPDCVVTPPAGVTLTLVTVGRMWADCPVNGADEELWLTWAGAHLSLVTRYNHRQLPTPLSSHAHWFYALKLPEKTICATYL